MQGLAAWRETLMIHARGFIFSQRRGGRKGFLWNAGLGGLGGLAIKREDFCSRKGAKDAKEFLWNAGLGGLGGLARDINDSRARITFSQRRGGRKGFLWNAGLGGLSGLARDFNDSRTRIYFLAKARRTQRIPMECRTWRTWRLGEAQRTQRIPKECRTWRTWRLSERH